MRVVWVVKYVQVERPEMSEELLDGCISWIDDPGEEPSAVKSNQVTPRTLLRIVVVSRLVPGIIEFAGWWYVGCHCA